MRKALLGVLLALVLVSSAEAYVYLAFEQITVDATAGGKGFTTTKINPSGLTKATIATCRLRTAEVSYLVVDPTVTAVTSSVGLLWEPGEERSFYGVDVLANFRAIRTGAVSGQLDCTYVLP